MQIQATFAGWDFNEIWGIWPTFNGGTPYLFWQCPIMLTEIEPIPGQEYTGSQITPKPSVSLKGVPLTEDDDFYYDYGKNMNLGLGAGSVTIVGKPEEYFGKKTVYFNIIKNTRDTPDFLPIAAPVTTKFKSDLTLEDIKLPNGYQWANPQTPITKMGEQEFYTEYTSPNYDKKATGPVLINITKGDGVGTVSIATSWVYGEAPKTPLANSLTNPGTYVFNYSPTQPIDAGDYTVTATFPPNEYYNEVTVSADFTITRAQGTGSVSMESWYAGETASLPVPASSTNGIQGVTYRYWSTDGQTYLPSPSVPSNPGSYKVEATFPANLNYNSFKDSADFDIFQIINVNVSWSPKCDTTFTYNGTEQFPVPSAEGYELVVTGKGTNAGSHTAAAQLAEANKGVSLQNDVCQYTILPKPLTVSWTPEREFVYNRTVQVPTPSVDEPGVELRVSNAYSEAGEYTVANLLAPYALITSPNADNYELLNNSVEYSIIKKTLEVSWTPEREFVYNKMVQVPIPSVNEPDVELRVVNGYSAAGVYEGVLAPFAQIVSSNAGNYELSNHTIDKYEIKKRDLNPYFTDTLPDFSTNKADTLWVPYNVFNDSTALHNALIKLIDYNGFATDTVSNESDNATVLKGTPKVTLQYIQTSPFMLSKRVETSQKATATIVTTEVSADNYALTRPNIVIMATVEEDETADKIFCRLGNNCAQFSAEVCSAISGQIVETCEIKVDCVINNVCIENTSLESCSAMSGEIVPSCADVPARLPALTTTKFRIWQTASGIINVDLGYMPTTPAKLQIYDLKGKLVATEQVSTRFANVRVGVPSGVYLFKSGNRITRAAIL